MLIFLHVFSFIIISNCCVSDLCDTIKVVWLNFAVYYFHIDRSARVLQYLYNHVIKSFKNVNKQSENWWCFTVYTVFVCVHVYQTTGFCSLFFTLHIVYNLILEQMSLKDLPTVKKKILYSGFFLIEVSYFYTADFFSTIVYHLACF